MSNGVEKIVSPLRKAMSELDYGLPEYIFDSEEGKIVADLIQKVWDKIDNLKYVNEEACACEVCHERYYNMNQTGDGDE